MKVYVVPFVRPVTVKLVAVEPVAIGVCGLPLTYGVTRYPVIGLPPSDEGAVQRQRGQWSPAVA